MAFFICKSWNLRISEVPIPYIQIYFFIYYHLMLDILGCQWLYLCIYLIFPRMLMALLSIWFIDPRLLMAFFPLPSVLAYLIQSGQKQ